MSDFQRIEIEFHRSFVIARFLPPPPHERYDGIALREELASLADRHRYRPLLADFGDFQLYPAKILGCLVHAKRVLRSGPIRCVNMPLRLQLASRFLSFAGSVLQLHESIEEAMETLRVPEVQLLVPAARVTPWTFAA